MDGILIINKPLGMSSHHCVNRVRKTLNTKKVGHSGTLDLEASGVLVLGINKGTKLLHYLNQDDKRYRFTLAIGKTTDTLDHTGKVITEKPLESVPNIDEILKRFIGPYTQMPPAFSAVKVAGKKLYEYARNNETIPEIAARTLTIHNLKRVSEITTQNNETHVDCEVHASKGIYVRVLANDIAKECHSVGYTTAIHRLQAGTFTIDHAVELDDDLASALIPMNEALRDIPSMIVNIQEIQKIQNGQPLELNHHAEILKCIDEKGQLLAIYERKDTRYKAKNVFI